MRFIAEQLSAEEAASVFRADGGLQPGVIQNAEEVIPGSELSVTKVMNRTIDYKVLWVRTPQ